MVDLVLLTVTCFFMRANSVENLHPDNGWRPMSIEKVLELQRNFIKIPNVQLHALKYPPERPIGESEKGNFVKITQKTGINEEPIKNNKIIPMSETDGKDSTEYQELIKIIQTPYKEIIALKDKAVDLKTQHFTKLNSLPRQAKMIEYSNTVELANNAIVNQINENDKIQYNDETTDKVNEMRAFIKLNKTYEVKENMEEEDQVPSEQELLDYKPFKYSVPELEKPISKNNYTANFLNILANYNIRTGDKLPNYAISLRKNNRKSPNHDYIFMYIPVKSPLKYNNANHLPVDPLLAVLLSNYGYYLPRLYGFHSGYNNLYGYLASNNIHNNKPFGSYKIFSDSESSY